MCESLTNYGVSRVYIGKNWSLYILTTYPPPPPQIKILKKLEEMKTPTF